MSETDDEVFRMPIRSIERSADLMGSLAGFSAGLMLIGGRSPSEVIDFFGGREEAERILGSETLEILEQAQAKEE